MNKEQIMEILPHRKNMLLLDEASRSEDGNTALGRYTVRGDEWFLQGHFPGNPVVPGVILCEIMGQSCCVLLSDTLKGKTPYFTGMNSVRFKQMVRPGDTIETSCTIERQKGPFYFAACKAFVSGKLAAQGELSFAVMEG